MTSIYLLGACILLASAFTSTTIALKRCGIETMRECRVLLMIPRVSKDTYGSRIPLITKVARTKKSYNVLDYVRKDYDQIYAVFCLHSVDGKMTYEAFLDIKYLRSWSGSFNCHIDDLILSFHPPSNICLIFTKKDTARKVGSNIQK